MPGGDRTGPWGAGPRTGRGMGFCAGYNVPGFMNPGGFGYGYGWGRGMGRGMGRGRGRGNRWGFYATGMPGWSRGYGYAGPYPAEPMMSEYDMPHMMSERDELKYLKEQAKGLTQALEEINARIDELAKTKQSKETKEG